VYISYTVPTCPPGVSCVVASRDTKYYIVSRHLTCSPNGGDYHDPVAVCRALVDVVTKLDGKVKATPICRCPGHPKGYVPPKAVGFFDGERRTIPLDGCSLCGLPGAPTSHCSCRRTTEAFGAAASAVTAPPSPG
jgi:hypothetical protein